MYTHQQKIITSGKPVKEAKSALILIHGRGGSAQNMLGLAAEFKVADFAVFAPQATQNSWYPYSFIAPEAQNQPALNSALMVIDDLVKQLLADGIQQENMYFSGFSQGACLTLEYVTRHAKRYGGVVAFTGGLIGEKLNVDNYKGDFEGTPMLITTSNPDLHVPLTRVEESIEIIKSLHGEVTSKVYAGRPHTILQDEIDLANQYIFL
jgi:phospholipase/carboxylesterase